MISSILIEHRHILIEHLEDFFLSVFTRHFAIMRSLYSKDARVTKCRVITHTRLQESNHLLPTVGDRYSITRT